MSLEIVTAPTAAWITTADAKEHLSIDSGDTAHDDYIDDLIEDVRVQAEVDFCIAVSPTDYRQRFDAFPADGILYFEKYKVQSGSITVNYTDGAGDAQTVSSDDYTLQTWTDPESLEFDEWPSAYEDANVEFTAGWAAADIPGNIRRAMLLLLAHWFDHRGDTNDDTPPAYNRLLMANRRKESW
jgi:uncharacterized phiE125 gp8 family phage protein